MISFQRQLARVPSAETYHRDKLDALSREQIQYRKHSAKWREMERVAKPEANLQFRIVLHAKTVLPQLLASQRSHIRAIEQKRSQPLEKLASEEPSAPRGRVVHDVTRYEEWNYTVFPVSIACAELLRHFGKAMFRLVVFGTFFPEPDISYVVGSAGTGNLSNIYIRRGGVWLESKCRRG